MRQVSISRLAGTLALSLGSLAMGLNACTNYDQRNGKQVAGVAALIAAWSVKETL